MALNRNDKGPIKGVSDSDAKRMELEYAEREAVREESQRLEEDMLYKDHPASKNMFSKVIDVLKSTQLIEKLADLEHERWSSWMKHQFATTSDERIARWKQLMMTPYSELDEKLKDLDRIEANKTLVVILEQLITQLKERP